jgi:hypothetical protein
MLVATPASEKDMKIVREPGEFFKLAKIGRKRIKRGRYKKIQRRVYIRNDKLRRFLSS